MFKQYIGDSVYAEFDGCGQIILTTENGLTCDPSNRIILDKEVIDKLNDYVKFIKEKINNGEIV